MSKNLLLFLILYDKIYLSIKKGKFMTKFITDHWIVIIAVLGAIMLGLVIALIVMDRKDKKLIAEYKASLTPDKASLKPAQPAEAEKVEEAPVEAKAEVKAEPKTTAKKPAAKKATAAKSTAKKAQGQIGPLW